MAFSHAGELAPLLKDPAALRGELLPIVGDDLRPHVESRLDRAEKQILKVAVDRLRRWWSPGVLFLGDAAHTMSPVGAQGLNLAMRDSIVAADHFLDALAAGRLPDESTFAAIEAERRPEIETCQAFQMRIGRLVRKPRPVQLLAFTLIRALTSVLPLNRAVTHGVVPVTLRHPVTV
jgi:2-polyprenyl-6-methoxyphenol hydroxylase-like FAD-dependent oxidoreductase